jgi:protein-S-isoprenylcysteine O-methyltransferase Ste14
LGPVPHYALATSSVKFVPYLAIVIASMLGGLSLLLFGFFLYGYSFTVVDFGWGDAGLLTWDALLCVLFFIQHSAMVRKIFRKQLSLILPVHFHGALYSVASGAVLIGLVLFWQNTGVSLASFQEIARWLANGVFFASLIGMIWGMYALRFFDVFGNSVILANIRAEQVRTMPLTVRGPYRWVRHPLYFFTLVMIWSCPDVTLDRLLFNVLFTIWIVIGTLLEERDLVAEFNETYRDYQHRVPMLIPWKLHRPYRSR